MLSNSSIQNQNVINSNNISGSSSGSVVCSSVTLTDGTDTSTFGPSNTTLNNLIVNGTSTFNSQSNFKNNVNLSTYNFDITNTPKTQGMRMFNNGTNNAVTDIHGIGTSTRFNFYSTNSSGIETNNLWIGYGNGVVIQGQTGQGIELIDNSVTSNTTKCFFFSNGGFQVRDATQTYNSQCFQDSTGLTLQSVTNNGRMKFNTKDINGVQNRGLTIENGFNTLQIQTWTANGRIKLNTTGATAGVTNQNLLVENSNHAQIQGTTGGIDCLDDQVNIFSSTLTPTISIAPTFPDNTNKIATTSLVTSAISNANATTVNLTTDDTPGSYYIPFSKTATATGNALFIDNVTGPLIYNPSSGFLSVTQIGCSSLSAPTATASCSLFTSVTTGSVNIMSAVQTTGSINIGSTTATTGVCNVRPPLVLARQIQTTNSTTYPPNAVNHLGYTAQTLGSSFTTTSLSANTNTNLMSYAFTSANYGTYSFSAIVALSPNDNTASRQLVLAISQTSATVTNTPFIDLSYSTTNVGYSYLKVQGVIQIYTGSPTIYLVGYCLGSAATVQTFNSLSHFTYTRIA